MYPHERSLVKKLAGKPFAILGINSDADLDAIKKVTQKESITWRNWWDHDTQGPIQTAYNISHWPTTYVLDTQGVIRFVDARGKALEQAIEKLLAEGNSSAQK
jgi:hypothetical protein